MAPLDENVVHDAPHFAAEVRLYGHHVAPVPQRDDRLLRGQTPRRRAEELLQPRMQPVVRHLDVAANDGERRAGAVLHLATSIDGPGDLLDDVMLVVQSRREMAQSRQRCGQPAQRALRLLCHPLRHRNVEQLLRVQTAAESGFFQRASGVHGAVEVERRSKAAQPHRLRQPPLSLEDHLVVGRWRQGQRQIAPTRERRQPREPGQYFVELQDA